MFFDIKFYFMCILIFFTASLVCIAYLPPQQNIPIVLVFGFVSLILAEFKSTSDVRRGLEISNAVKAEHIKELMTKATETNKIVKELKKNGKS